MKKRRSITPKDYNDDLIDDDTINSLIECANTAPTHGKNEPWRFVVFKRESLPSFFNFVRQWYNDNHATEEKDKSL